MMPFSRLQRMSFAMYFKTLFTSVVVLLIASGLHAQKDSSSIEKKDGITFITKFADAGLPGMLLQQIRSYKPEEIVKMHEEFQQNVREDDGEYTITMRLWFEDDHVMGYIKKAPIGNNLKVEVSKTILDIAVEWCGVVDSTKQPICVKTMKEMQQASALAKISDWHQKPDEAPVSEQPAMKLNALKKGKGKNVEVKDSTGKVIVPAKLSKKEMKKQIEESYKNADDVKDSTGKTIPAVKPAFSKPEEPKKKGKKEKPAAMYEAEAQDSTAVIPAKPAFAKPEDAKKKSKKDKPEAEENKPAPAKTDFGKPDDAKKKGKKDKKNVPAAEEELPAADTTSKKS